MMNLHHIGYVVTNASDQQLVHPALHLVAEAVDDIQSAKICLYKNPQNELVELVQPLDEKSPVWNFLQKHPNTIHHYCYEISESELLKHAEENHLIKIMGPVPTVIFNNQRVVFYVTRERELVEFILK